MMEDNELFALAIKKKGKRDQIDQCIEELNELAVALSHLRRSDRRAADSLAEVLEEITDSQLGIDEMIYMFKIPQDKLRQMRIFKKEKLEVALIALQ